MSGEPITYERCNNCGRNWVLPRTLCPSCGSAAIEQVTACGNGRVFAATVVYRAPSEAYRPLVPYRIGLVDLDEGPRLMAHLQGEVPIGACVEGRMETVAGETIPVFARAGTDDRTAGGERGDGNGTRNHVGGQGGGRHRSGRRHRP